jgi:wobble nucleotide-excising tRNase
LKGILTLTKTFDDLESGKSSDDDIRKNIIKKITELLEIKYMKKVVVQYM